MIRAFSGFAQTKRPVGGPAAALRGLLRNMAARIVRTRDPLWPEFFFRLGSVLLPSAPLSPVFLRVRGGNRT